MARFLSDVLRTMRLAIGRRNENDPDSNDETLLRYVNDFANLTMSDDLKIFEQFGNLTFTIDTTVTDGVYTFNDVGAADQFTNISAEGFISLLNPINNSISWNQLQILQDPGLFYSRWGINNSETLIPGYPTEMLYYGTEMVFRTIPNDEYQVQIYGYKILPDFSSDGDPELPQPYWMRYLAYGAALNYGKDYRFEGDKITLLTRAFASERKSLLTRTHNQITKQRSFPRF